jgi:hypothetical protein
MAIHITAVFDNLSHAKLLVIENTHHAYKENNQTTATICTSDMGRKRLLFG